MKLGISLERNTLDYFNKFGVDLSKVTTTIINPNDYLAVGWDDVAKKMYDEYKALSARGFNHFYIQMKSRYAEYHDAVLNLFAKKDDVNFIFGEPYDAVERGWEIDGAFEKWDADDVFVWLCALDTNIQTRKRISAKSIVLYIDLQERLWGSFWWPLSHKTPSSYFRQEKIWSVQTPFIYIYADVPTWHCMVPFVGSYCYKRLKKRADELGIEEAIIYAGDGTNFFSNKLWHFFGLDKWWKRLMVKRAIKIFGGRI